MTSIEIDEFISVAICVAPFFVPAIGAVLLMLLPLKAEKCRE